MVEKKYNNNNNNKNDAGHRCHVSVVYSIVNPRRRGALRRVFVQALIIANSGWCWRWSRVGAGNKYTRKHRCDVIITPSVNNSRTVESIIINNIPSLVSLSLLSLRCGAISLVRSCSREATFLCRSFSQPPFQSIEFLEAWLTLISVKSCALPSLTLTKLALGGSKEPPSTCGWQ